MSFSERYGYANPREVIQLDFMDEKLRNGLWNALTICIWNSFHEYSLESHSNERLNLFLVRLWISYYHNLLDSRPQAWASCLSLIRNDFFNCKWYQVYDFLEFLLDNYEFPNGGFEQFVGIVNGVMEDNVSAYRIIDGKILKITDAHEIEEVESAIVNAHGAEAVHIQRALELLSDRESPDYRNSIKESISAVESLVQNALNEKGTLGQLLKKLEEKIELHAALKNAFSNLYGYTSDAGGIRHALSENSNVDFEDAKFMLVTCSAFINYVRVKLNVC